MKQQNHRTSHPYPYQTTKCLQYSWYTSVLCQYRATMLLLCMLYHSSCAYSLFSFFAHPLYYLRTFPFFFSLPSRNLNPGSPQ